MSTIIQVKDDVKEMLDRLKKDIDATSYDEVIRHLLRKAKTMEISHFGSLPDLKPFQRE